MRREPITAVMTTNLVSIECGQPMSEVYFVLKDAPFQHVPVLENERPVGIISSTDVLKLVYDIDGTSEHMLTTMLDHQFSLEDAMSTDLVTLPESATVHDAAEVLAEGKLHSVLVVDVAGELVGIVTTTDLVRYLRDL